MEPAHQPHDPAVARAIDEAVGCLVDGLNKTTITLSQARKRMQWITISSSGVAFCFGCPCGPMIAPVPAGDGKGDRLPSNASHDLFPGQFHNNPFIDEFALCHFASLHRQVFSGGIVEMISRYGEMGLSSNAPLPEV